MILLLAGGGPAAGEAPPGTPVPPSAPLREARQILELSPTQLKQGPPAQIQLIATHVDVGYGMLFGQDQTAGLYLSCPGKPLDFKPGAVLEVKGFARPGLFAPFLEVQELRVLGEQPPPPALPVLPAQVLSGSLDSQWVEITGVIHSERMSRGRLQLEMVGGWNRVRICVINGTNCEALRLIDSLVRVRGVVASEVESGRRVKGFKLLVSGAGDITVVEAAPEVASLPLRLAKDLQTYDARRQGMHRVRVQGLVTFHQAGGPLFLQDPSGAVHVESPCEGVLQPGEVVDAVGFLTPQWDAVCLEHATVRKLGAETPPPPVSASVEQLFSGAHHHALVELEARLVHHFHAESNVTTLMLASGARFFTASLQTTSSMTVLDDLEHGSQVRLTGVCERPPWEAGRGAGLHLWLRSPADVRVLMRPPRGGVIQWLALALALLASALLAGLMVIHRRHRLRTVIILQEQSALQMEIRRSEEQLRRSMQERERMGQDLHDDIIQSIYAVGLGLEDTRRQLQKVPEQVEPRLAAAIKALNEIIRNVRSFIGGLEPKVLNGHELKTALKSLALTTGESQAQFVLDVDAVAANRLTSSEATQLLHMAKEAMSNSLRHAQASRITVALQPAGQGVRLEVSDDGQGFDPAQTGSRGQGLRNLESRAAALGARLEKISSPGQGCRIVVSVPKQTADEHN